MISTAPVLGSNREVIKESEIIIVGGKNGNVFSGLTRGAEGTPALSHGAGDAMGYILLKLI